MKKKILIVCTIAIVILMTFGLVACFGSNSNGGGSNGGGNGSSTPDGTITLDSYEYDYKINEFYKLEYEINDGKTTHYTTGFSYDFTTNTANAKVEWVKRQGESNKYDDCISAENIGTAVLVITYQYKTTNKYVSEPITFNFSANEIKTEDDLKAIANSNKSYVLANDISLSGNWTPIEGFTGVLDGKGHTITGLNVNSTSENLGLFGVLKGTVKNLNLDDVKVTSRGNSGKVGALAGTNNGTIDNVTVSGVINPKYCDYVGGIVGYSEKGAIFNCANNAEVEGNNDVGGIAGYFSIDKTENFNTNENFGIVKGNENVGGIVGYLTCPGKVNSRQHTYLISDNINTGTITGKTAVGGIIGKAYAEIYYNISAYYNYFEFSLLQNDGIVSGTGDFVGGVLGYGFKVTTITVSENTADISGGNYVGGLIGYSQDTEIDALSDTNTNTITGKAYLGGFAGYCGVIKNAKNNGDIISTAIIIEDSSNCSYVGGIAGYCKGLIDCVNIKNIVIENAGNYVGGLAGYINVSVNKIVTGNTNTAKVEGTDNVGGIAGYLTCPDKVNGRQHTYLISDNRNAGTITGKTAVGGIIGKAYAEIYYNISAYYNYFDFSLLENEGVVSGTGDYVGGLIGYGYKVKTITVSENTANITGGNYVGGFLGYSQGAEINAVSATNTNTITGKAYVGGFAGYCGVVKNAKNNGDVISTAIIIEDESNCSYVGGIAGYCEGLISCVNNNDIIVENSGKYVGGLAGYINVSVNKIVTDNTNTAKVEGTENVGGIVGYLTCPDKVNGRQYTYLISENRNTGAIKGETSVGGIIGKAYAEIYYNIGAYYNYFDLSLCQNEGTVNGKENYVGGLLGYGYKVKTITNCSNTGNITGENYYVGGFVGYTDDATTISAYNFKVTSVITGKAIVGGLAGQTGVVEGGTNNGTVVTTGIFLQGNENNAYVGGIVGICGGIKNCVNNSNMDIQLGNYVGGIAGEVRLKGTDFCNDNTNNGDIIGRNSKYGTGGVVGNMCGPDKGDHNFAVSRNVNHGEISGNGDTGGVFGAVNGNGTIFTGTYFTITYCKNYGMVSRLASSGYVGGIAGYQTTIETAPEYVNTNTTEHGLRLFGSI